MALKNSIPVPRRVNFWLAILSFFAITFQNCSSYQASNDPLHDDAVSSASNATNCLGDRCDSSIDEVTISIGNQPPVRVMSTDLAFDVGGYCNTAGFSDSKFYYSIRTDGTNTNIVGKTATTVKCDSVGRWALSVPVPGGFNYTQVYVVTVTMTVIDEKGIEQDNPRKTNSKEIRTSSQ